MHLPRAVDDLGVVVHREDARHDAGRVAGELEHGDGVARAGRRRPRSRSRWGWRRAGSGRRAGTRSKSRLSTTRSRRRSGSSSAKRRNQGCCRASVREHVLEDAGALAALLRAAQHGLRRARPAAQHAEGVADREQGRGRRRRGSASKSAEERRFPGRVLADALAALGHRRRSVADRCGRVRRCRRRARSARPGASGTMCRCAARRRRGRGCAGPCPTSGRQEVAGRVLDGVDQRVVAEVGPAVVHVEDGDVDRLLVGGRQVLRPLDARVAEDAEGRGRRDSSSRKTDARIGSCAGSREARLPEGPQPTRPRGTHARQVYRCGYRASTRVRALC